MAISIAPAPCIAVIGPASSGKTSLLHLLDDALQQHPDEPLAYVVKGNPDGSARYVYHSSNSRNKQKGEWTSLTLDRVLDWVRSAREHLELVLVDVGGSRDAKAQPGNKLLFAECSHYLVLARGFDDPTEEREKGLDAWVKDAESAELKHVDPARAASTRGLECFARVRSTVNLGEPFFDAAGKTGLFRGDAIKPRDTLNHPLVEGLTASLMDLRLRRTAPEYFDLRRRPYWEEAHLTSLNGALTRLRDRVRETGEAFLGGVAPIFAYAAALHHALNEREDATVRIFDPKVPGGEVLIPRLGSPGPSNPFPDVIRFEWVPGKAGTEMLTLRLAAATPDKFLGPDVVEGLPGLSVRPPPKSLIGVEVQIDGSAPIWLHLTLSGWLRSQGASHIGHWDEGFGRFIWVWPLGPPPL